jgi:hypothetical protein
VKVLVYEEGWPRAIYDVILFQNTKQMEGAGATDEEDPPVSTSWKYGKYNHLLKTMGRPIKIAILWAGFKVCTSAVETYVFSTYSV